MSCARLRIPTGWLVEWNTLNEPIGTVDLPLLDDLTEDLLLVSNKRRRVVVAIGWLPEFKPHGRFVLTAAKLEEDADAAAEAWQSPLRVQESGSYSEIVAVLEDWLADETLGVY